MVSLVSPPCKNLGPTPAHYFSWVGLQSIVEMTVNINPGTTDRLRLLTKSNDRHET